MDGESWTDLPGFVPQDQLDDLMGHAAVLVNPSRREGYGLVVVEASAHGTPVVLVDGDGNAATELIEPGANGFIARSTDPEVPRRRRSCAPSRAASACARPPDPGTKSAVRTRTVERTVDADPRRHRRREWRAPKPPKPPLTRDGRGRTAVTQPDTTESVELTILMPCLNEAETLAVCIEKAQAFLAALRRRGRGADLRQRQHRRLAGDRRATRRAGRPMPASRLRRGAHQRHRVRSRPLHHHGRRR